MIKAGIIGCGVVGKRLAIAFTEHDGFALVAVCDIIIERANTFAQEYNTTPYTSYETMIDQEELDLLYIGVPPKYHKEISNYVIEKNKHVICEKPLALNFNECQEMIKHANNSDIISSVNLPLNYSPGLIKLKEMIHQGELGEIRRVELKFRFPQWPRSWQAVDWLAKREQGGPLREVGTHFYFALDFLGLSVRQINAIVRYYDDESYEKEALGYMKLENDILCALDLLCDTKETEENSITIYGSEKVVSFVDWYKLINISNNEVIEEGRGNSSYILIDEMYRAINQKKANLCSFEVATDAQKILEGILYSNGKWVLI